MQQLDKLKQILAAAESDAEKFFTKGNASAGTRLRQRMQELKTEAQNVRLSVQEQKKA